MFTIAVTTAPRPTGITYLPKAIASLRRAGIHDVVHVFAEPHSLLPADDSLVLHDALERQGCFQNWARAARWFLTDDSADWLLVIQDDCLWRNDAGKILRQAVIDFSASATLGFLSPYTSKAMLPGERVHAVARGQGGETWCDAKFHGNAFWGAVATLWPRASLQQVVESPRFVAHTHTRKVDVVIGNCCRDLERDILVRCPSLATHAGAVSTLGRDKIPNIQWGRVGFGYRATR